MLSTSGEGCNTCVLLTGNDESPGTAGLTTLKPDESPGTVGLTILSPAAVPVLGDCAEDTATAAATVVELSLCL